MLLASDPLIDRFYWSLSIKGSEVQKQRPHELLWMLWFDGKSISNVYKYNILLWAEILGVIVVHNTVNDATKYI